jgi:O-antigen/teichoic acid export membrane protein
MPTPNFLKTNSAAIWRAKRLRATKRLIADSRLTMMTSLELKSPPRFSHGLLANFVGTGWSALMQLVCTPLYVKFLGIEAYGLIGFYLMFQAMMQVLDLGLSPTMNREMARYSAQPEKGAEARDLVRTLEVGYWLIGSVVASILFGASAWIATHWIKAGALPIESIKQAVVLMGMLAFFQWPLSFYQGGLMGLHQQVLFNIVRISVVTMTSIGTVLILWLVSPTIRALLLWQTAVSAVQAVVLATLLWKCLPSAIRAPRFDFSLMRNVGRFAVGMGGITLIGLVLTQIDKVFVSKFLSLKVFGYYTLAWAAANGLSVISGVIFSVIFPRMSAQFAVGNESGIRQTYHVGSQLMAVVILPFAAVFSFFPYDVMHLWTRSTETAIFAAPIFGVLVIGSALNALLYLPHSLQLAFGWTRLSLTAGLISIFVVIPVIIPATKHFGPIGAAAVWAVLNILTILLVVPIMHQRLLQNETGKFFKDIGLPMVASIGIVALGRLAFTNLTSPGATIAILMGVWFCAFGLAVLAAPQIRSWMLAQVVKRQIEAF